MRTTAKRVEATPMAPYVHLLQEMSQEDKLAVMAFLVDTMQEEKRSIGQNSDADFFRQFLATPFNNPMSADETKHMIRESRHFGDRKIKSLHVEK